VTKILADKVFTDKVFENIWVSEKYEYQWGRQKKIMNKQIFKAI